MVVFAAAVVSLTACGRQSPAPLPGVPPGPLTSAEAYLARGDGYATNRQWDLAIADYSAALQMRPDWAEAYNNRGYAYYWQGDGDGARALADYNKAIELRPDYAYAYNNRGAAYMAIGDPAHALRDLDRTLQLNPNLPQAYTNRGNTHLRLGHLNQALADFRRARTVHASP